MKILFCLLFLMTFSSFALEVETVVLSHNQGLEVDFRPSTITDNYKMGRLEESLNFSSGKVQIDAKKGDSFNELSHISYDYGGWVVGDLFEVGSKFSLSVVGQFEYAGVSIPVTSVAFEKETLAPRMLVFREDTGMKLPHGKVMEVQAIQLDQKGRVEYARLKEVYTEIDLKDLNGIKVITAFLNFGYLENSAYISRVLIANSDVLEFKCANGHTMKMRYGNVNFNASGLAVGHGCE